MSRDDRFRLTQEMLDRIDAVVSGHETQRTTEFAIPILDRGGPIPLAEMNFTADDWAAMAQQLNAATDRLGQAFRATGVSFADLIAALERPDFRHLEVPAKAAHRRRFGR